MTSQQLFLRDYGAAAPTSIPIWCTGGGGGGGDTNIFYGPYTYQAGGGGGADTNGYPVTTNSLTSITKGTTYTVTVAAAGGTTSFGNLASASPGSNPGVSYDGGTSGSGYGGGNGSGQYAGGGGGSASYGQSGYQTGNGESKGGDGGSGRSGWTDIPGRPGGSGLGGYYYAGGGGGGGYNIYGEGIDGGGAGGSTAYSTANGYAAIGYGGGGGGASYLGYPDSTPGVGGAGGAGFVHIWYDKNLALPNSVNGANTGVSGNTRYYTWYGSGSITW